ncbi:MAG TPA: helix-turn-helix domain-containing protein [Albitalea sp.]|nr:helix-turn-helix domain-containing protein [Albitalea sp.]
MDFTILTPDQLRQHLQSLRRSHGLTQGALGERLGVGQVRIANIEQNPGAVSVEQFMRLLATLGARLVIRADLVAAEAQPARSAQPAQPTPAKAPKMPKGKW